MQHLKLWTLPIVVLVVLFFILTIFNFNLPVFNVPYLKLALNIIFLTAINIYVAIISGKSYANFGALNLLIISNVFLIVGVIFLISGLVSFAYVDYAIAIQDIGLFIASGLQVLAAIVTLSTTSSSEPFNRRIALGASYFIAICFVGFITAEVLLGVAPVFVTSIGSTLIGQAVLILTLFFFASAGFIFLWQYIHSKEEALYWYSLALFLFAFCSLGFVLQTQYGDNLYSWIGTIALYLGSLYFLTALLRLRRGMEPSKDISDKWAESLIFDRKQASALFANMLNGFTYNKIILDENGKPADLILLEANNAFENIIGVSRFELLGKKASTLITPPTFGERFYAERYALLDVFGEVALTGKSVVSEFYFASLKKWLHISVYSPKKYYFVALFEDITQRKELEEKLSDYTKNLEKLVEDRTRQLKESERLAAIGQTAGMIGHDIRNPLQAITNELYIAKQTIDTESECKERNETLDSLRLIQEQTDYISKIVSDLQDYSKILKPELSDVDLSVIVTGVLQTARFKSKVNVSINVASGFKVKTDPVFVKRILTNLVSNSLQAMPDSGKLDVSAIKKENQVIITVSDTGNGIPEEVKPKIFKPLFTTKAKGQGLGLAVVKRLVEALDGTITFESQEGRGTTFTVTLPVLKSGQYSEV